MDDNHDKGRKNIEKIIHGAVILGVILIGSAILLANYLNPKKSNDEHANPNSAYQEQYQEQYKSWRLYR